MLCNYAVYKQMDTVVQCTEQNKYPIQSTGWPYSFFYDRIIEVWILKPIIFFKLLEVGNGAT